MLPPSRAWPPKMATMARHKPMMEAASNDFLLDVPELPFIFRLDEPIKQPAIMHNLPNDFVHTVMNHNFLAVRHGYDGVRSLLYVLNEVGVYSDQGFVDFCEYDHILVLKRPCAISSR